LTLKSFSPPNSSHFSCDIKQSYFSYPGECQGIVKSEKKEFLMAGAGWFCDCLMGLFETEIITQLQNPELFRMFSNGQSSSSPHGD
jgi:hypothetical protein